MSTRERARQRRELQRRRAREGTDTADLRATPSPEREARSVKPGDRCPGCGRTLTEDSLVPAGGGLYTCLDCGYDLLRTPSPVDDTEGFGDTVRRVFDVIEPDADERAVLEYIDFLDSFYRSSRTPSPPAPDTVPRALWLDAVNTGGRLLAQATRLMEEAADVLHELSSEDGDCTADDLERLDALEERLREWIEDDGTQPVASPPVPEEEGSLDRRAVAFYQQTAAEIRRMYESLFPDGPMLSLTISRVGQMASEVRRLRSSPAPEPLPCVRCLTDVRDETGEEGVIESACQLYDGRWTCSRECWERVAAMLDDEPAPATTPTGEIPERVYVADLSGEGDLSWSVVPPGDAPPRPDDIEWVEFVRAAPATEGEDGCRWEIDDEGVYDTGCGNRWSFEYDGPAENGARFCPYCGKLLQEPAPTDTVTPDDC